ncbi:hypothetical protein G9A89_015533 [Geosiphon pyriformis]|nr:hypothetical protein G9A89_015533 [Geosiphon pyriformis]
MAQVFNQFIKRLWSSILRSVRPCHPTSLQDAITLAYNFKSVKQKANHTQAINLAINGTSDINAKIIQLIPYTQPPPQNYYQPPPMTQAISHYQTYSYSPSRP